MKANRRSAPLSVLAVAILALMSAACSEKRVIPTPSPTPRPAPPPPSVPPQATTQDWRTAPLTPGDWSWGLEGGQSTARFAGGLLTLRCDRSAGTVTLARAGRAAGPEPMTVTATAGVRTLSAAPQGDAIAVALPARDPVLDAMAFSRGRFVVEAPGTTALYVPSWPEVSRVAEDCR